MPTFSEQDWNAIKKNIDSLILPNAPSIRSMFCIPAANSIDGLLLTNLKNFLELVNSSDQNVSDKSSIMIGALCYFHYQHSGLQTMVSGSNFASVLAPLVVGTTDTIKKSTLVSFANFVRDSQDDIFRREDDNFSWLFGESEKQIKSSVENQLKAIDSPGLVSGLWNSMSFT